ncbi:MAG: hypothetical protein QXM71_07500 [Thermofilum sp.]
MVKLEVELPDELVEWFGKYANVPIGEVVRVALERYKQEVEKGVVMIRDVSPPAVAAFVRDLLSFIERHAYVELVRLMNGEETKRNVFRHISHLVYYLLHNKKYDPYDGLKDFKEVMLCTSDERVRKYIFECAGYLDDGDEIFRIVVERGGKYYKIAGVHDSNEKTWIKIVAKEIEKPSEHCPHPIHFK